MARMVYYGYKVFGYIMLLTLAGLYFQLEISFISPLIMIVLGMILVFYLLLVVFNFVINQLSEGYSIECNVVESKSLYFVNKAGSPGSLSIICLDINDEEMWFTISMHDLNDLGSNGVGKFWIQGSRCSIISKD